MHRSKLSGFCIDCNTDDLESATRFWSAALGLAVRGSPADDPGYRRLEDGLTGVHIEVQTVTHPSRVHLDIESDDIEAEVRRLEALGATRVADIKTWVVMQAPTGQRFCVVRPQDEQFAARANTWYEN